MRRSPGRLRGGDAIGDPLRQEKLDMAQEADGQMQVFRRCPPKVGTDPLTFREEWA